MMKVILLSLFSYLTKLNNSRQNEQLRRETTHELQSHHPSAGEVAQQQHTMQKGGVEHRWDGLLIHKCVIQSHHWSHRSNTSEPITVK